MNVEQISVMKPLLPSYEQYSKYLREVDLNRTYSNWGPLVQRLEHKYAEKLGLVDPSLVVLCSNATIAIQGFMQLSRIPTWHVQSFTFPATVHAAIQSGKDVVLADIDANTWMISAEGVENSSKEGIVPVLPFGADLDATKYADFDHVLIDAAASIGGAREWIKDMKPSWGVVFSLHATKSFGIGEGGLIVFGAKENADEFRSWINFGFSGQRVSQMLGTNAKLSEVQAAVGLAVFDNWDNEQEEWLEARAQVDKISSAFGIQPGPDALKSQSLISPYWIIQHSEARVVDEIERSLFENSIGTRRWWMSGAHNMPAFRHLKTDKLEHTDFVGARYLGLPFYRRIDGLALRRLQEFIDQSI